MPISPGALIRAETFLRKQLANGPMRSAVVGRAAVELGIPRRTLDAAKGKVARSFRPDGDYDSADRSGWYMELVEEMADSASGTDAF